MARDEASVKVRLKTRQAKSDLRGLTKDAAAAAGRIGGGIRSVVGRGLSLIGMGAGVGAGLAAFRGATQSGIGDIVGESIGVKGSRMAEYFLGDMDESARADKRAREETIQAFGAIAGETGKIPPGAQNYFNQIRSLRLNEEKGRELFERDTGFRRGGTGNSEGLIDRTMNSLGETFSQWLDDLGEKIP